MIEISEYIAAKIKSAEVLVVGGSAGSLALMQELAAALPVDFPMPVVGIIHRGRNYKSILEDLLQKQATVNVKEAKDKEMLKGGTLYIAPADYHLLIEQDHSLSLDVSEPLWYCRPSIDILFESAADVYDNRIIGMLFSGANQDGASGIESIHRHGGLTMVQDPKDAEFREMPESAIDTGAVDLIFSVDDLKKIIHEIHLIKRNVFN